MGKGSTCTVTHGQHMYIDAYLMVHGYRDFAKSLLKKNSSPLHKEEEDEGDNGKLESSNEEGALRGFPPAPPLCPPNSRWNLIFSLGLPVTPLPSISSVREEERELWTSLFEGKQSPLGLRYSAGPGLRWSVVIMPRTWGWKGLIYSIVS